MQSVLLGVQMPHLRWAKVIVTDFISIVVDRLDILFLVRTKVTVVAINFFCTLQQICRHIAVMDVSNRRLYVVNENKITILLLYHS